MMNDLFNNTYYLESCENPINGKDIPQITHISIPRKDVSELLKAYNMANPENMKTIEEFGKELGYEIDKNGDFIKDINKPLNIK